MKILLLLAALVPASAQEFDAALTAPRFKFAAAQERVPSGPDRKYFIENKHMAVQRHGPYDTSGEAFGAREKSLSAKKDAGHAVFSMFYSATEDSRTRGKHEFVLWYLPLAANATAGDIYRHEEGDWYDSVDASIVRDARVAELKAGGWEVISAKLDTRHPYGGFNPGFHYMLIEYMAKPKR